MNVYKNVCYLAMSRSEIISEDSLVYFCSLDGLTAVVWYSHVQPSIDCYLASGYIILAHRPLIDWWAGNIIAVAAH